MSRFICECQGKKPWSLVLPSAHGQRPRLGGGAGGAGTPAQPAAGKGTAAPAGARNKGRSVSPVGGLP